MNQVVRTSLVALMTIAQSFNLALASEPGPAPEPGGQSLPAVDGINGKLIFGRAVDGTDSYAIGGAVTLPIGDAFGLQIDADAGQLDGVTLGNIPVYLGAAHLFWRNPSKGLVGFYGDYAYVDLAGGLKFYTAAVEGGLYLDRFTVDGLVGVRDGDLIEIGFYDRIRLLYYPLDDLNIHVGHSYAFENHSLLYGAEWAFGSKSGAAASLFVAGALGEGGGSATLAGLKFYLGHSDKSLIKRHREDDPPASSETIQLTYQSLRLHQRPGQW
ncbi:MAG: hypothetical protein AB3N20_13545 [Rhizobiaceae bacterium]